MEIGMSFHDIYALPISSVFAIMIVLSISWAIIGVIAQCYANATIQFALRVINGMFSIAFLMVILRYTVIGRTSENDMSVGFIRSIEKIKEQPELLREMVMNSFLFFPIGLTLPYALTFRKSNNYSVPMIITVFGKIKVSQKVPKMLAPEMA